MCRSTGYAAFAAGPGACRRGGFDIGEIWRLMACARPGDAEQGRQGRGWGSEGGRGGFASFPFGPGGPWGGPWGGRRGPKARRGDIRTAALLLLAEEPRNGYQIMQALEERSHGAWRPSPGSVYPALQQLEDEGLVRAREEDGRKLYELTDEGRRHVERRDRDAPAPWEQIAGDVSDDAWTLLRAGREVGMAVFQVMQTGSEAQRREAQRILAAARRDLYRLLADGEPTEEGDAGDQS